MCIPEESLCVSMWECSCRTLPSPHQGAKAGLRLDALKVLISLAWLEKELSLWGVGMGSCTLPAGVLRGVSHRFLGQCASTLGPPSPSGVTVPGLLCCKSEFLAVLIYSNNMSRRRRMETGTVHVTFSFLTLLRFWEDAEGLIFFGGEGFAPTLESTTFSEMILVQSLTAAKTS